MIYNKYTLKELATIRYGKNQKNVVSSDGSFPIYGTGGLMGYASKYLYDKPSVLIGRKGTIDKVRYVTHPFWTVDTLFYTEINDAIVIPHFLYYVLSLLDLRKYNEGTSIPSLRTETLNRLELYIPPLSEQKKILSFIEPIEEKIDINSRINRNLSEQIAALYQAWFIDYEPFKDGDFVDSEVGEIPVGWRVEKLVNLCDTISKKHKFDKEELIFLNTGDIEDGRFLHGNYSAVEGMPGQAKKSIKENDILYSEIRPVNRHFAFVNFEAEDYVVSTKLMVIRSKGMEPRRLYQFLTSQPVIDELQLEAESRSGTFPQIRFENVGALKMVVATDDVEKKYAELLQKFYAQIDKNVMDYQRLTELRDSLLPKLMSGELDVSDLNI